jgi:geranylgeranyl diphosphate synthase, type I
MTAETMPARVFKAEYAANLRVVKKGLERFGPLFLPENLDIALDPYTALGLRGCHKILMAEDGKRVRGTLGVAGYRDGCKRYPRRYNKIAAEGIAFDVESRHLKFLIEDDMADEATTRRNEDTVHTLLHNKMREDRRDDPAKLARDYTEVVCELIGTITDKAFWQLPIPPRYMQTAKLLQSDTFIKTGAGQGWDMHSLEPGERIDVEQAQQVAIGKTAHYTIGGPWSFGEASAGVEPSDIRRFSEKLGIAFQVKDDIISTYSDPAVTGKSNQDDYLGRKGTLLVALTHQRGEKYAGRLDEAFMNPDKALGFIAYQAAMRESGAVEIAYGMVGALTEEAVNSLPDTLSLYSREFLGSFAFSLIGRQH